MKMAQMGAAEIGSALERGLAAGAFSNEDLFAGYTDEAAENETEARSAAPVDDFARRILPPVRDALFAADAAVSFCAATAVGGRTLCGGAGAPETEVDQTTGEPSGEAVRAALASARSETPSLIQTYRGVRAGAPAKFTEISAPIQVAGAHWGGFRVAVTA
ncbi:MAG: hypothetical protein AAF360_09510 [Pseudomonadota bacterium]